MNQFLLVGKVKCFNEVEKGLALCIRHKTDNNQDELYDLVIPKDTNLYEFKDVVQKDALVGIKGKLKVENYEIKLIPERISMLEKGEKE